MQPESVANYLEDKSLLVTGATGLIAKLFLEKVLRIQPKVKKLYLLVRAADYVSAKRRVETEVMQTEVFEILEEKYQGNFPSYFWDKVCPLAGDITFEDLGIHEDKLKETLWSEINVIVHVAANIDFNERYDTALGINTFGVKHISAFAMRCPKLKMLLHISTAYVTPDNQGALLEQPLSAVKGLDIEAEMALVQEQLKELTDNKASEDTVRLSMKKLGLIRAQTFGWSNTYTFTKAMGEMLFYDLRRHLPLVILRPTIVTSTWKEPFPGWIEGVRTTDAFITGYGMGHLKYIPADVTTILDLVPGDLVVNAMLTIIASSYKESSVFIYQIGSSTRNPITIGKLAEEAYRYFLRNPCIRSDGRIIKVKEPYFVTTMTGFYIYMVVRNKLPLQVLRVLGALHSSARSQYNRLSRQYNRTVRVVKGYKPYTFFHGRFDDTNMQKLTSSLAERDKKLIAFDTKSIDWESYLTDIHIPGIFKYGIRADKKTKK
ncbi:probable fatty acyl-CoA reductase 4 isoform X1 [Ananas comosus]|uniref:Fatty acyl-CoA reductase n=2 Tax=Ananas comosus TaxID=4615 RepID=A0A6P5ED15_ANACO|nr:probable fatty acyl-CoA reductase 4 isoform X1 [Ananas comosus]